MLGNFNNFFPVIRSFEPFVNSEIVSFMLLDNSMNAFFDKNAKADISILHKVLNLLSEKLEGTLSHCQCVFSIFLWVWPNKSNINSFMK